MAVHITTSLNGNTFFSCDLNEIDISTDKPSVNIQLKVSNEVVFNSTYYAVNGHVRVTDLSSLFEAVMEQKGSTYITFTLIANDKDGEHIVTFFVIFCRDKILNISAYDFLNGYFLTTNLNRLTTIHSKEQLSFYLSNSAQYNMIMVSYKMKVRQTDGTIADYNYDSTRRVGTGVVTISFSVSEVQDWARTEYPGCTLLYFSVTHGSLVCRFYVQPCPSAEVFRFQNNFGCMENVSLPAVTTSKLESEFSEAKVNGRLSHYDVRHTRSFDVESAPLLASQMTWLEQFVTSPNVMVWKDGYFEHVLIKDYSFEQTNAPGEENTLSFTWQFADGRQTKRRINLHTGIFTEPFNDVYA